MSHVCFSDIDLLIDEGKKEILINPKGERFYFVECDEQHKIFRDAIMRYDSVEERYEIEGEQTLYTEHKGMGLDYEKLLCLHPQELIHQKSFFGFTWYNCRRRTDLDSAPERMWTLCRSERGHLAGGFVDTLFG